MAQMVPVLVSVMFLFFFAAINSAAQECRKSEKELTEKNLFFCTVCTQPKLMQNSLFFIKCH